MASSLGITRQKLSALVATASQSGPARASSSYGRSFWQACHDAEPRHVRLDKRRKLSVDNCQAFSTRRHFSTSVCSKSAWPAGADAEQQPKRATTSHRADVSNALPPAERAITAQDIADCKQRGEPIAVLTAYDYSSALSQRSAKVDICLVGDSLANVALGHRTTQSLTLDAMIHHVQAVVRGLRHPTLNAADVPPIPLVIADLPYGSGVEASVEAGVRAATRLVQEGSADGVKIEGGDEIVPLVQRLASFGILVMSHIGLQPQRASSGSALSLSSRTAEEAMSVLETAKKLERAGAFSVVLEAMPSRVGAAISRQLRMPTIGIGAGSGTDGQVLVADDILGECSSPLHVLSSLRGLNAPQSAPINFSPASLPGALQPHGPRFVRNFVGEVTAGSSFGALRIKAVQAYVQAVKARTFPNDDVEGYKMKREEWAKLKQMLGI